MKPELNRKRIEMVVLEAASIPSAVSTKQKILVDEVKPAASSKLSSEGAIAM